MKLNYKRTALVGLAFFSIMALLQMYDSVVPKLLTKTFAMNETLSGAIMALDNVLALFLLPFFGSLSDKTRSRLGRRTPFIIVGTVLAVALMNVLPLLDNSYAAAPSTGKLVAFVAVLGLLLVAMGIYRSPAVALMPDVTPKPLRSRGNAIINLMGAVGGIMYLGIAAVLYPNSKVQGLSHVNYQSLFLAVSIIMVVSVAVLVITVREPKLVAEQAAYEAAHPEENLAEVTEDGREVLPKSVKVSLAFLLLSVALWYIGYNAVTTWWTTYVDTVMGQGLGNASMCLMIATGGAILSYLPMGNLAARVGRKKVILGGVVLISASYAAAYFLTVNANRLHPLMYVVFVMVGVAWAAINVNSLPMVVEMCRGGDVGKFTGYYYTFSMAAQVITPVLSGFLLRQVSYNTLFPYAAIFSALAIVTMFFVRHGDNEISVKKGIEAFEEAEF